MVLLFCNTESVLCLLVAILLSTCLSICNGISTQDSDTIINHEIARPEVKIPQGTARGVNMVTRHGRNIFGFKGIPYAQPPVGNLRFERPLPPDTWNGTLDASSDSNLCPQLNGTAVIGDEDCLYLHVYTPRLPASENATLLPVLLYVFGGRFKSGHANPTRWGPNYLLDKDIVLVVPNYRLGVFGFLSTGDEVSPGNYGLKDLVRALEWNRDNIRYFGGDPNRVTLAGSSSGAAATQLLTLSDSTTGLFHRYITHSGSAVARFAHKPGRVLAEHSTQLGEYLGCPTNTSTLLVNCLKSLDASVLVNTDLLFNKWRIFPQITWGPTVEPDIEGAILTDCSTNLIANGKGRDLPWMLSTNRNEGVVYAASFYKRPDLFEEFLNKIDVVLPYVLEFDGLVNDVPAYTTALKSYYLNDLSASRNLLMINFTQLVGDALFVYPIYSSSQHQLIHAKSPQYFCSFEYRGTLSYSYYFSGGFTIDYGVSHADDLLYLFHNQEFPVGPPGSEMNEADWKMVDTMVQLWTSFVINGTPTNGDPNIDAIWQRQSSRNNYIRIGNNSDTSFGVEHNFLEDRMRFWEQLSAAATSW